MPIQRATRRVSQASPVSSPASSPRDGSVSHASVGRSTALRIPGMPWRRGIALRTDRSHCLPSPHQSVGEPHVNKIHSKIWSKSLQRLVVASELAKTAGKGRASVRARAALICGMAMAAPIAAHATDGSANASVVGGVAWIRALSTSVTPSAANVPLGSGFFQATGQGDGSDDALAAGNTATAAGAMAAALGDDSTAVGARSLAMGTASTALGADSLAVADQSVALGSSSNAGGVQSTAVGNQSYAQGDYSTSLGGGSFAMSTGARARGGTAGRRSCWSRWWPAWSG